MEAHPELNSAPKLAKKMGISTSTVWRLKNGTVDATLGTLEKLAAAFDVEPWQLLVPGMEAGNLPTLQALSERERQLYSKWRESLKAYVEQDQ